MMYDLLIEYEHTRNSIHACIQGSPCGFVKERALHVLLVGRLVVVHGWLLGD